MKQKKPYELRTDVEKIRSNWNKTRGLFERGEYSVSIVRAATVVELAANLVVRRELIHNRGLPAAFVDSLLVWANGLNGKIHKLVIPITEGGPSALLIKQLVSDINFINQERNKVSHRGEFKKKGTARSCLQKARDVTTKLVTQYETSFSLKPLEIEEDGRDESDRRLSRRA